MGFSGDQTKHTLTPGWAGPGRARGGGGELRTAGFAARQVQDDGLDALSGRGGVGPPRPAEVAERSHSFARKVVGGEPVVVHHREGQAGEAVAVVLGTHVAAGHAGWSGDRGQRTAGAGGGTHK